MTDIICPHCEAELGFEDICWQPLPKDKRETSKTVYYCANCKKILGFTDKK